MIVFKEVWGCLEKCKTQAQRITVCYYLFRCRFLQKDFDSSEIDGPIVALEKKVIDHYLSYELDSMDMNTLEVQLIRKQFGLDDGLPLECGKEDDLFTRFSDVPMPMLAKAFSNAQKVLDPGFYLYPFLKNQLLAIEEYGKIEEYVSREVKTSNFEGILFYPSRESNPQIGGYIANWDDFGRTIGWTKKSQFSHALNVFDNGEWLFRIYDTDHRPFIAIEWLEEELVFSWNYEEVGFHGKRYRFAKNKNAIIEEWQKGKKTSEVESPYQIDVEFSNCFRLRPIKKGNSKKRRLRDGGQYYCAEDSVDGHQSVYRYYARNGDTMIGQRIESGFDGATLRHRAYLDTFEYCEAREGEPVEKGPRIVISKPDYPQKVKFTFYDASGKECYFLFSPDSLIEGLVLYEGGEKPRKLNLSNPFLKKAIAPEPTNPLDKTDPEQALESLIGLEVVKKQVRRLKALLHKERQTDELPNLNMAFLGNPGTGKTIVARLLGRILVKQGVLPKDTFIEVDRGALVGNYLGQTENKVKDYIEKAMGGVMFIDEAYALYSWDGGKGGNDYGNRAIEVMVKAMEDYRGKICFIFAGYKKPMERMMSMNRGFRSRVNRYIEFPNYTMDELRLIVEKMASDAGYQLAEGATDEIMEILRQHSSDDDFANARDARNILETLYEIQAERTYEDRSDLVVRLEDVKSYESEVQFKTTAEAEKESLLFESFIETQLQCPQAELTEQFISEASVNIKVYENDKLSGEGSGFFITPNGLIGTCAHVISDAGTIKVGVNLYTTKGKRISKLYDAVVIDFEKNSDVGLIKILNPDMDFTYYQLAPEKNSTEALTQVIMGGYPLGGDRFSEISINRGVVQSLNKDAYLEKPEDDVDRIYVDLTGHSGNSGSGVLDSQSHQLIGVFAGVSYHFSGPLSNEMNYAIPVKYLWELLKSTLKEEKEK